MPSWTVVADAGALPLVLNPSVYHGDTWSLVFSLQDTAGAAHDLTGATFVATAQDNAGNDHTLGTNVPSPGALSAALATTAPLTSLPTTALTEALASGETFVVSSGTNTQEWTTSAAVSAGATSVPVNSQTPNFAYPAGALLTVPSQGELTVTPPSGGLTPGIYTYDVEVTQAPNITTWVHGQLSVTQDITP